MGFKVEHSLQLFYNKTETYSIIKVIGNAYFIQAQLEKKTYFILIMTLIFIIWSIYDISKNFSLNVKMNVF